MLEFPPHGILQNGIKMLKNYAKKANENFKGNIFDMKDYILNKRFIYNTSFNLFKGIFPSWDNSARKAYSGAFIFADETPKLYKQWLKDLINWTKENKSKEEQIIFVNAWNEWAEGAHLEADMKNGYAYLQATKEVLEEENGQILE